MLVMVVFDWAAKQWAKATLLKLYLDNLYEIRSKILKSPGPTP
jgi:hypothetical protein